MANVQIPEELFFSLFRYHCLGEFCDQEELDKLHEEIGAAVEKKLEALATRNLYTKYKTAPTAAEREKARQEYLDQRGIGAEYRWKAKEQD